MLFTTILSLVSLANAQPSNVDFMNLKTKLEDYIKVDSQEKIVKFVRMSFHDLLNYDPIKHQGGPHGCLIKKPIIDFDENKGLSKQVNDLQKFVTTEFPSTNFTFGDVISLAGKVAIETAYPCMQIKWRFGRLECKETTEKAEGPSGSIDSFEKFKPFSERYGLSYYELAILTAGSHGLSAAAADMENSGFGTFDFGSKSGKEWIEKSISNDWKETKVTNSTDKIQYETKISANETHMRLASDLVFFQSVMDKIGAKADHSADEVEQKLKKFTSDENSSFDKEFERIYSKMLEIGVKEEHLIEFVEPEIKQCIKTTNNNVSNNVSNNVLVSGSSTMTYSMYSMIVIFTIVNLF